MEWPKGWDNTRKRQDNPKNSGPMQQAWERLSLPQKNSE